MKKAIFSVLQFLLFLVAIAVGSFARPFGLQTSFGQNNATSHIFVWDGFLLAVILFAGLLAIELLTRRVRTGALTTTLALLVAAAIALALKLGFITREL